MLAKYIRYMVKNHMFAVLSLLFTTVYWINAHNLPRASLVFPLALLYILVPLFIWNFAAGLKGFRKALEAEGKDGTQWECSLNLTTPKVIVTLLTLAYIVAMPLIGFVVTTTLYLAGLAYYLGVRKPVPLFAFTTIYVATLYAVFVVWLSVRLPNGLLM